MRKWLWLTMAMLFFAFLRTEKVKAQSIPVGTPVLEDYYRRAQLLGKVDFSISFTSRPFFPVEALKLKNSFNPEETLDQERIVNFNGIYRFWGKRGLIQLLPLTWQHQFSTDHPYSLNDGAMIPARGYQTMMSGGFYAKAGPLSIQLRPEVVLAENKPFETFTTKQRSDQELKAYYDYKNIIDFPEYFPDEPYKRIFWGQSSICLTAGPVLPASHSRKPVVGSWDAKFTVNDQQRSRI